MSDTNDFEQLHWLLCILQDIDTGLMVLDRAYKVKLWNAFMENHSGVTSANIIGKPLFGVFPDLPREWLKRKIDTVFKLNNRVFCNWQQRPYLMRFDSYRPITGGAEFMYQNLSLFPLPSLTGEVGYVCLMIHDVTDIAMDELELQKANEQLKALSRTDGLTGLLNRRSWEELLEQEFSRCRRNRKASSLVMFDIDHFKQVNDNYGHPAGDEVIRSIARTLIQTKRSTDQAGRYGGEEFAVILLDTDEVEARIFCERLRRSVESLEIRHDQQTIRCTISLGVACLPEDADNCKEWIEAADRALYHAKESGRNRTTLYREITNG